MKSLVKFLVNNRVQKQENTPIVAMSIDELRPGVYFKLVDKNSHLNVGIVADTDDIWYHTASGDFINCAVYYTSDFETVWCNSQICSKESIETGKIKFEKLTDKEFQILQDAIEYWKTEYHKAKEAKVIGSVWDNKFIGNKE